MTRHRAPASFPVPTEGSPRPDTNSCAGGGPETSHEAVPLSEETIQQIFQQTLQAVEDGHRRLGDLGGAVRAEYERTRKSLEEVKQEALRCVEQVDDLEARSRAARFELFRVSRDYQRYTEEDVRKSYEQAERLQILLGEARERERFLRERRAELERGVARLSELLEQAERLQTNIGAALEVLKGNLAVLSQHVAGWRERYEMGRRVIRAQEEERYRVARDLHDGTAQGLASIAVELELSERMLDTGTEAVRQQLQRVRALVRDSLGELRRVIFNLRPMALDELGVIAAVRRYADHVRSLGGPEVEVAVHGPERRFDPALEVAVFRVVQEAIHNARRHSGARHIQVYLETGEGYLNLTVRDDGRGFDPEVVRRSTGGTGRLGLLSMEERVELFGGRFAIQSAPGVGTRVSAHFPLQPPTESGPA